jgi:acetyl-CoA C-acetyltransferase
MTARQPILVGVGQLTNRAGDPGEVMEPLAMMAEAARRAADDAGLALREVDELTVINCITRTYADPAGMLAEQLGCTPRSKIYTAMGGNSPQWRVNESAARIARGEVRIALIAGAEAMAGAALARRAGVTPQWAAEGSPDMVGDARWGNNAVEQRHNALMPTAVYPLFENALRASRGWSIERHRQYLGELCSALAAVAKDNPYAWFRDGKSAAEITTVADRNRMIGWPYPKYMNAIIAVDQAAALLLTDTEAAHQLGIPESKWVYVVGCGDATDHWLISDRVNFHTSPAIRAAGADALAQARVTIDEIDAFDLYSCFPCAVQIGGDMLGIGVDDQRPRTVTGALPYHGGPGNNYVTHAIASMAARLRAKPGTRGLVTGVGWYLTKHAVGIYQSAPPAHRFERRDPKQAQAQVDAQPHPQLAETADGAVTVETYTVMHDREGKPASGIVVARLGDGRRCWANLSDTAVLERIEREELIGTRGHVRHDAESQINRFTV